MPQLANGLIVVNTMHTCHCRQLLLEGPDKPSTGNTQQGGQKEILSLFSEQARVMQRQGNREFLYSEPEVAWGRMGVPFLQNHCCSWRCYQAFRRVLVGAKR